MTNPIDFFLGTNAYPNQRVLQRARTLIGILLTLCGGLAAYSTFIYITVYHQAAGVAIDSWLFVVPLCALMGILLIYLRHSGHHLVVANILVACLVIVLSTTVYVTGGPSRTPALPLLIVPVVIAFCIAGRTIGLTWAAGTMGLAAISIALELGGHAFPSIADQEFYNRVVLLNWSVAYIAVVAIVLIYESINVSAAQEQLERQKLFHHLATHDSLTGVSNRRNFESLLEARCNAYTEGDGFIAVLFIDLDDFKPINDEFGHAAGDLALSLIAERLSGAMRLTDHVARIGGDEFAVLAEHIRTDAVLDSMASKILAVIEKPIETIGPDVSVSASIGVAFYPQHARTTEELLKRADKAMYAAKAQKSRYVVYSE